MNKNILNINQKKQQNNEQIVKNNMPEICQTDNSLKLKIINVRSLATPSPTRSPIKSSQMQLAAASSSSSSSSAALGSSRNCELTKNDLNFCNKIFGIAKVHTTPPAENYNNDIEIEEIDDVEIIEVDSSGRSGPYKKTDRSKITKNNRAKRKFDRSELAKYAKFYNQIKSIGKTKQNENISANATAVTSNAATDRTDMRTDTASSPIVFSAINTSTSAAAMNKLQNRRKPVHQPLNDEMIVEPAVTGPKHLHATRYSTRKTKETLNPGKKITLEDKKYKERMATVLSVKTTNSDAMTHLAFLRVCANVIMQEFGKPQIKFSKNRSLDYLLKKFYQRK